MEMVLKDGDSEKDGIVVVINAELTEKLVLAAEENHMGIQEYIEKLLDQIIYFRMTWIDKRPRGLNRAAIDELLKHRDEIKRNHPGVIWNTSEEIHQMREERMRELEDR